jgi:hypothetical protein
MLSAARAARIPEYDLREEGVTEEEVSVSEATYPEGDLAV